MYIARIDGVFDEYFYDKFIWDKPSEVKKYLMSMIDDLTNILANYDTISSDEFLRIINRIYRISTDEESDLKQYRCYYTRLGFETEEYYDFSPITDGEVDAHEMIKLYNMAGNTSFGKIRTIKTNMIRTYLQCEGHGKDYDEWEENYQEQLVVLTDTDLDKDKIYTKEEIDEMIKNGIISVVTTTEINISKKDMPKEKSSFKYYGFDKEEEPYKSALVKLIKEEIPKERLFKDVRKYLKDLRTDYMSYCHFDERKEAYGANELEEFYQLKFKYKKKWNNKKDNVD